MPGPGQYSSSNGNVIAGPNHGFGTSNRNHGGSIQLKGYVPGPGQYSSIDFFGKEGVRATMKFRP